MPSRRKAFSVYLEDIYAQYDRLAAALSDCSVTVSASDGDYAVLGDMQGADIEALAFLVLMEAAKSAQEDLKAIMDEVKAINQTKQRLRDTLSRLQDSLGGAVDKQDGRERQGGVQLDPCATLDTDLFVHLLVTTAARQSDREVAALASSYTALKERVRIGKSAGDARDQLDTLSEMSELEQMRLQMALDRRSKFIEALSNIMKKMSETSQAITQNLK